MAVSSIFAVIKQKKITKLLFIMKKYFLLIVMSFAALGVMAQTTLVATLTHAGVTTEYYGENAFVKAVEASVDGDLITLSEGLFKGTTINKSLNIRGNGVGSTQITSDVILDKSADEDEANHWLNIEGITFNAYILIQRPISKEELYVVKDLCMTRCDIKNFSFVEYAEYYYSTLKNCSFINCRITESIRLSNVSEVSFINCIVRSCYYQAGRQVLNPKVNMLNCVFIADMSPASVTYLNAKNSVLLIYVNNYRYYSFPTTVGFQNCVISGYIDHPSAVDSFFNNGIPHDKTIWMPMEEVFATLTEYSKYDATNDYQLKEIASEGVDGTLLGIYNGEVPYTSTVTYPHFTTFNVAEKAVDGKLSVEVATE